MAAGLGVQGSLPCRRAPVCCTSWCAPRRAAPAGAPQSQSRRPYSDASRSARCGRASARPLTPAPSVAVLDSSGPHPQANPLCFCQRGSPESLPFPGVLSAGFPKRVAAPGARRMPTRGPRADPCTTSCWARRPRVPLAPLPADCSPPEAGGGEASAWSGRDYARAGGVGVRQGGTALNALDSPAPALSPPSSADSWGLCFLHPPRRSRSAPTATRDSPSATAAVRLAHPREPGHSCHPFSEVRVGTPAEERPGQVQGDPPAGRLEGGTLVKTLGSQGELVTRNKVPAGEMRWAVRPHPRRRPARLGEEA